LIAIIDYGIGNLASVRNAFLAQNARVTITSDPKVISGASGIVLPGVGAFGKGMSNLVGRGLVEPIKESVAAGKPFLGICLGLQFLFTESCEGGQFAGLDLIPGTVERLQVDLKVPHIGWNQIEIEQECPELDGVPNGSFFYFVHSYHVVPEDKTAIATKTDYGVDFVSAIKKDSIFACQFHPERSGNLGLHVIRNFVALAEAR